MADRLEPLSESRRLKDAQGRAIAFSLAQKNKSNPTAVVDRQEPSKEVSLAQLATQSLSAKAPSL